MADGDCVGDGEASLVNLSIIPRLLRCSSRIMLFTFGLDYNSISRCYYRKKFKSIPTLIL